LLSNIAFKGNEDYIQLKNRKMDGKMLIQYKGNLSRNKSLLGWTGK
jgi:hypothetical protein